LREQARHSRDLTSLRRLETGAVLAADLGYLCFSGCPPLPIRAEEYPSAVVPRQASFPATFLGSVLTTYWKDTSRNYVDMLIFIKKDTSSPWQMTLETGYFTDNADRPEGYGPAGNDEDLFTASAPSLPGFDVRRFPAEFAADWQSWADRGVASHTSRFAFETGGWIPAEEKQLAEAGVSEHYTFTTRAQNPFYEFAVYPDRDLACTNMDYTRTLSYTQAGVLMHQPSGRLTWGKDVPPGDYLQIAYVGLVQVCFQIQPKVGSITEIDTGLWETAGTGILPGGSGPQA
jgi:hypothetical protein